MGPTGATGAQGLKGEAGGDGAIGPQGFKGDTGATGATGPSALSNGTTAPAGATGAEGSMYIDTSKDMLYGPKANGVWGPPRPLKGQGTARQASTTLNLTSTFQNLSFAGTTTVANALGGSTIQASGVVNVSIAGSGVVTCQPTLTAQAGTVSASSLVFPSIAGNRLIGSSPVTAAWVLGSTTDTYTVGIQCKTSSSFGDQVTQAQVNAVNVSS